VSLCVSRRYYVYTQTLECVFTRTHTRTYTRMHKVQRHPRCSLRTRDTVEVMREPERIVPVKLYYATSPSIYHPFSLFSLSPYLYLFFSHLYQVGFFVATARFVLFYGIALYIHAPCTTNMIASFLKTSLCMPKTLENYLKVSVKCCYKKHSSYWPKLETKSHDYICKLKQRLYRFQYLII